MKDVKCPLCRTTYTLSTYGIPEQGCVAYSFECEKCRYELSRYKTLDGAVSSAKKFISKFPPIMRVHEGDKLHFLDRQLHYQYFATVEKVNLKDMWIKTERGTCRPDDVLKWPWELEQKGGAALWRTERRNHENKTLD